MQILIVTNTLPHASMLTQSLLSLGHDVQSVSNGHEVIPLLLTQSIQCVIIDWQLADSMALCANIRSIGEHLPAYVYILFVGDDITPTALMQGFTAGTDDFMHWPLASNELQVRLQAGERILNVEKSLNERNIRLSGLNDTLLIAHGNMSNELKMAGKMLWELLPPPTTQYLKVSINWLYCPSNLMSGDLFNFMRLDETHVGFYSLDVAGHGVSAAMMSFSLYHLLTTEMQRGSPLKQSIPTAPYYKIVPPEAVMAELNTRFQTDSNNWLYFTMIYGVIDTQSHTVELCQAGHPNPIFLPQDGAIQFIGDGGFPIGLTDLADFERITLHYQPGDHLVLYSDGITECANVQGELFGEGRLLNFFKDHKALTIEALPEALNKHIQQWRGSQDFDDDVSLLILALQ